jgi:hypothetical protein
MIVFCCDFLVEICTLLEQCTILGLSSSWGTSRMRPAWSPCEHQLTPALSPIWGPHPKPRRQEEVVYSPNESCSHFTQRLFPPKLPQQHTCTIFNIRSPSFILIIHHIQQYLHPFITRQSYYHFFNSSWQADCSRSPVSDTVWSNKHFQHFQSQWFVKIDILTKCKFDELIKYVWTQLFGHVIVHVRYHCGGWSEEVNSCILISYMVYL